MNVRIRNVFIIGLFLIISGQLFAQTPYFTTTEYKKALWMTTRFYGGQRSGDNNWLLYNHLPSGVNASLTGKSFITDADAGYDLSGGWHDCGDHVKFGQTEFYSAYMLLKGYDEFKAGYGDYYSYDYQGYKTANNWNWEGTGHAPNGIPDILDEVKHATDYFIKCTKDASTFYYQVGQGNPDHMLWETSVKMQTESVSNGGSPRVAYKNPADASMPSFCGAALALMSRLYRPYDAAYADLCLVHAQYAYTYAKAHPGTVGSPDGGFYPANGNWKDDYSSMCAELYLTTNTASYKTEALSFSINKSSGADINGNSYGFDYTNNADIAIYNQYLLGNTNAVTVLNSIVTSFYLGNIQSDGQFNSGNTGWGPTRYNANTAFIVALWQKMNGTSATPNKYIYDNIDYLLGKNSSSLSFVVGFGSNCAKHPHHRNFYLVDNNPTDAQKATMAIPAKNAQFGLMVGGTRNASTYTDQTTNYQQTEGGLDYNACLVGVLGYINSIVAPVSQHPVPNLGADKSLCGVGTIVLNSGIPVGTNKTFTWKKDNVVVQAASASATTYNVNAAGTYVVILDSAGKWSTSDEIVISASLPAVNLGSAVQLCNPATATLDIGVTGTGYTYQWKKNNVVIAGATSQTYEVTSAGTYVGTLSASGCTSTSGSIVVTSALPVAGNDTLCAAGTAALTITGSGGPYQWYDAATNGTLLTTGNSYSPSVTATKTYYVQDGSSVSVTAGPSSASNPLSSGANGGKVSVLFTAAKPFTITQLKVVPYVYGCNAGDMVTVSFDLYQGATKLQTYTSTPVACTGVQSGAPFNTFYTLNFSTPINVPAAGNYTLTPSAGNDLVFYSAGANFTTMDAAGVMDITDDSRTDVANSFPGIFDIKIQSGSACARTPVYAIVNAAFPNCKASKTPQTITFGAITAKVYGDPDFTLAATASSGLAVTYTSSNPAVATLTSAGVVAIVGVGSTIITANQAGNATYNAATAVTQTLVVGKANQTITFGAIAAKVVGDANFTLTATASSGLAVTYTSSNPAVATVTSAGVVTIVGAGSTVISANQAGNTNYNAATAVTQTLVVGKANQTITFGAITAKVVGSANFTLTATASSGLAVTYTSSNPAVATVTSAGVVTIVGAGSTVITASQAGNANYNAAMDVTQILVVGKASQTITFGAITAKVYGDPNFTLTATASSGLAVTYTSSNPAVATVTSAGVVTIVGAGATVITASQAGNANYNVATDVTQTLVVGKASQTITFGAIASKVVGDPNFTLTATASSGLSVTYTSSNPAVATVTSAGVVTIVGNGSTVITASQAGNATYNAATDVTQTLVVGKANQTITFGAITAKVYGDLSFTLAATASSGLAVTYTSSNPAVATVTSAGVVTIVSAGSTIITASQAGNANYTAATAVTQTLVVGKASQTITFGAIASKAVGDPNFSLTATASSGLAVTYTSSNPAVATVTSAGVVTIVGAGSTVITASQAGNANYTVATVVTQTFVVTTPTKTNQTITFGALAAKVVGDANFSLTATASSGLTVTYTSSDPVVATVTSAGVVTIVGAGSTVITASQAGNATYNAAPSVTQTLTVTKKTQTVTFDPITGTKVYGDPAFPLTSSSTSGLPITYATSDPSVATVSSSGVVTIVGAGTVTITATQAGDGTYASTSVPQTITIGKANQTITFGALASKVVGDASFSLTATASSGLAVTYTSSNPAVATVTSAGVVTIVGAGSTVITASQVGNTNYNAAAVVTQTLVVTTPAKTNQTITFGAIASKVVGDASFSLTATASSGLAVTYTSSNPSVATVTSAGVVTIVGAGSTVITASQAGNATYNAAPSVTQTLTVTAPAKTNQTITFGAIASKVIGDPNFTLSTTASSGLAVTYTSSNPAVATITSAGVVTIVGAGSTVITASQAGNATYNSAPSVTQTLVVTSPAKTNQTITFGALASKSVGDANFNLTATASSGLAVTYTSSNPTVATITSAGVVTIVGAGSTVITASQGGNATYNAAPSVTQTLVVASPASTGNMKVISSSNVVVVNNSGTTDIGAALINTSTSAYTFTISNIGTTNLVVSTISAKNGFAATQIFPSGAIAPNGTATFTVTGIPNDASTPTLGTVTILSNDVGNSPFTINVSARVGTPTGVATTLSGSAIELFPNPTTGSSNIEFNGSFDDVVVTIYSADGSKALVADFSSVIETYRQLDIQALPAGVYFVEINTAQGKLVKRLIKQ